MAQRRRGPVVKKLGHEADEDEAPQLNSPGQEPRSASRRLAELVAAGRCCDCEVVLVGEGAGEESAREIRVPAVRALLASASPRLEELITASKGSHEIKLPVGVTLRGLQAALAFTCGTVPASWRPTAEAGNKADPTEVARAAQALAIPGLERWWAGQIRLQMPSEEPQYPRDPAGFMTPRKARPEAPEEKASKPVRRPSPPQSKQVALHPAVMGSALSVAAAWAWRPALEFNFTNETGTGSFMDDTMIRKNANVNAEVLDWWNLWRTDFWGLALFEGTWTHKSWRPLTVLSFRWNYLLHGYDSRGFHLTNISLHALCSLLLGLVSFCALDLPLKWSLLLAGLFLAHPVHTESVLYIVGRADLLCFALILLAVLVYTPCLTSRCGYFSGPTRLLLACSIVIAAGLTKETGFCFFGLLAGWELLRLLAPLRDPRCGQQAGSAWRLLALLLIGTAACAARMWYTSGTEIERMDPHSNPIAVQQDRMVRILTYFLVHGLYAKLLVWPTFLCYDYSFNAVPLVHDLDDARLLLPIASYLGVATLLSMSLRPLRGRRASTAIAEAPIVGVAILVLSFFPMSNILFPVGTMVAERLLYIPSAGVLLALVGLASLAERGPQKHQFFAQLPGLVLVTFGLALAWLCAKRVPEWRDAETLQFADGLKQLQSARVQFNLGNLYLKAKRYEEALQTYRRCMEIDPEDHDSLPLFHAGQILFYYGDHVAAERMLNRAVSGYFSPLTINEEEIWHDYALSLWFVQKPHESILTFQKALAINPTFTKALNNLHCAAGIGTVTGVLEREYLQLGLQAIDKAIQLDPGNILYWRNAAAILRMAGEMQAAEGAWQQALALDSRQAIDGPPRDCSWEFYFR